MYEVFYNLKAEPFRLSPDHKFCFEHKSYAKARAYMAYAFKRAEGFVMITGRPGTGKTTLIGELVESLAKDRVFTANLVCTQMDADDLLKTVAYSFGIGSAKLDKAELLHRLTILFHRWHREGRRALLIVDEAQDLSSSAMEELRLLTNIQIGGQPLLQIFLLGQPELKDLILSPPMEQVHQRVVAATHIEGLEADETEAYVIHRLVAVGWRGDPAIDRAIFPVIHKFSEGVPRRINLICSRLFLLGSVEQRHAIELEDVRVVISELQAENLAAGTGFSREDFVDSGQNEWVQVASAESPVRSEPHLRAVNSESYAPAVEDLVEDEDEAKKKDVTEVTPVFHPISASDPIGLHRSDAAEQEASDDMGNESFRETEGFYDNMEVVPDPKWLEPEEGERNFAPATGNVVESPSRWRRGIALVSVAIVALVLTLFLWAYLSHQESRSNPRIPESRAETGSENSSYSETAPVTTSSPAASQISEPVVAASPRVPEVAESEVSPSPQVAEVAESTVPPSPQVSEVAESAVPPSPQVSEVAESAVSPSPRDVANNDAIPGEQHQDAGPANLNDLHSPDLSPDLDIKALPDATAVPENSEQTILVNFASDSDDLLPDSHQALNSALEKLRDQPDSLASITGFSDSRGDAAYNLKLSRKRADAVEQYLVDGGIARNRLRVEGRGVLTASTDERFSDSEVGMELSRIVQITFSRDLSR